MCRQLAIIPNQMSKGDILDMLIELQGGKKNSDGFGFGYVLDGKFIYNKTHLSLEELLRKKNKNKFFGDCFNHNSWVLFHVRAASRGGICAANSHPHEVGNWLVVHNGTGKDAELIKACFGNGVKYHSQTDTEVYGQLISKIGPKRFSNIVEDAGVFLALERNGDLWAIKTSAAGDLAIALIDKEKEDKSKVFLISELNYKSEFHYEEVDEGWIRFDKTGAYIKHKEKTATIYNQTESYWNGYKTVKCRKINTNSSDKKKLPSIYNIKKETIVARPARLDVKPFSSTRNFDSMSYYGGHVE